MSQKFLLITLTGILGLAFSFIINPGIAQAQSIDCFTSRQAVFQENICAIPGVVITKAGIGSVVYIQGGSFSNVSNQVLFFDSGLGGTGTVRAEVTANVILPPPELNITAISQLSFAIPSTHYNPVTKLTEPVLPGTYDVVVQTSGGKSNVKPFTLIPNVTSISPTSGKIGDIVTINGSGFYSPQVKLGDTSAVISSVSNTELKVKVPSLAPGTYKIRVFSGLIEGQPYDFLIRPYLKSLNPNQGSPSTNFVIEGGIFSTFNALNNVFFSGKQVPSPLESTTDKLTVKVPDLPAGSYTIKVSVRGASTYDFIESDNFLTFTILPTAEALFNNCVINQGCPNRKACCESGMEGYENYLHYIVEYCKGEYNPEMCISPPAPAPTTAPTGLIPSGTGISLTPTLSWQPVPGATSYQWKITRNETGYQVDWGSTDKTTTGIGITLLYNQTYTLAVKACNEVGACGPEDSTSFTTISQPGGPGAPGAPGGVTVPSLPFLKCDKPYDPKGNAIGNPLCAENIQDLIDAIIKFIFWIAIVAAPVMILIGAFYYVTSAGDTKRITTAKNIILYTVIGLAIILFSRGLIAVIRGVLGG